MATKPLPTPEELRQLLRYEPETGNLYWLPRSNDPKWSGRYAGKRAFTCKSGGYWFGRVNGVSVRAHRVIWAMIAGRWPQSQVDHINRRRDDNRIANLREATPAENMRNQSLAKNNTSGAKGVRWKKDHGKWCAQIMVGGRSHFLGYFDSLDDAKAARTLAAARFGFHA